jgi:polysaccharide biosynthesis/export protein
MNKIFLLSAILAISSCTLVPNRMFKPPKDYVYATDTSTSELVTPYKIHANDWLEMHIFSNDGFRLVDVTPSNISSTTSTQEVYYIVEENGEVKLPVIGRVLLKGLSIKDGEDLLEDKYTFYYKDPFVILRVVNRQAIVFSSDGGKGTVIELKNDHTTLFEALALAGGVSEYSKSKSIKIIRGNPKNPEVYFADASTLEGLRNSTLQIYPNDIIYLDSGSNFRKRLINDFLPFMTVLTTLLVLGTYFK